jgi:outer membrane immunogenic protein
MPDDIRRSMGAKVMKGRPMRRVFCALLVFGLGALGLASPACAQDYPFLRGSETVGPATFTRWSGFYAGGDFNYTSTIIDFSRATGPSVAMSLQDTVVQQMYTPSQLKTLGNGADNAFGYGAFLGYNMQWQDLITGVEADYTHTFLSASSSSAGIVSRSFTPPAGNVTNVTVGPSNGRLDLTDYGEIRGRAGYVVGNLLPYGFVGVVVGSGNYSVSTHVDLTCTNAVAAPYTPTFTCQGFPQTPGSSLNNALLYGLSAGAGLEWAVTPNVFLRGEFEFVQFASIDSISVALFTARVGAGFKF